MKSVVLKGNETQYDVLWVGGIYPSEVHRKQDSVSEVVFWS